MGTPHRLLPCVLALLVSLCAACAEQAPRGDQPSLELEPCDALGHDARCGRLEVFEDRDRGAGRRISLNVVVLPALGDDVAPDPLFVLAGGPGQAASRLGWVPLLFAELRQRRDIVLVDQRGTGDSNPLACDASPAADPLQAAIEPMLDAGWVRACREKLEKVADLRHYTTVHAVDDLDDVRAALGYERINLYGGSYGTRPLLVYLRRHARRARSAVAMGVAHTSFKYPLHHAPAGQRALDQLFEACRQSPACLEAYGDPREDLDAVLSLFAGGPVEVRLPSFERERPSLRLSRDVATERLRTLMYFMAGGVRIPGLLHRAANRGDLAEITQSVLRYQSGFREGVDWFSGMWLSVTCTEDAPLIERAEVERLASPTVFRDYRVRRHLEACAAWPRGELPPGFDQHVRSQVPVLILSGELDPATPASSGAEAAAFLPKSRHVVARQGHGPTDPACLGSVTTDFIEQGDVHELDVSCLERVELPDWR